MDKLTLVNANDAKVDVNVIRFFNLNNKFYLIYSMNEVDEQNYLKLYAVRINVDNNVISASNITDDNEWNSVKDMIKTIIKGNKEGNLNIEDLDYNKLENLKVTESKVFKLSTALVELLQANKKLFAPTPDTAPQPAANQAAQQAPQPEPVVQQTTQPNKQPVQPEPQPAQPQPTPEPSVQQAPQPEPAQPVDNGMPEVDYQSMYLAEKANNEKLNNEIEKLKTKMDTIKNMLQ